VRVYLRVSGNTSRMCTHRMRHIYNFYGGVRPEGGGGDRRPIQHNNNNNNNIIHEYIYIYSHVRGRSYIIYYNNITRTRRPYDASTGVYSLGWQIIVGYRFFSLFPSFDAIRDTIFITRLSTTRRSLYIYIVKYDNIIIFYVSLSCYNIIRLRKQAACALVRCTLHTRVYIEHGKRMISYFLSFLQRQKMTTCLRTRKT